MIELSRDQGHILKSMFAYTHLTMVRSFIDGCMGRGWVDRVDSPACAQVTVGDVSFLAGDPTAEDAARFVDNIPCDSGNPEFLFVPENDRWADLVLARHGIRAGRVVRYAFQHGGDFPTDRLSGYAADLPDDYTIEPIDEKLYRQCLGSPMKDLCSQFATAEDYVRRGIGFCAVRDGKVAGGASSYTVYRGGIEIEVDVDEGHRRKGLALACSARLILECLARGIYPSWDAANLESANLARKLGYVFSHEYGVYAVEF